MMAMVKAHVIPIKACQQQHKVGSSTTLTIVEQSEIRVQTGQRKVLDVTMLRMEMIIRMKHVRVEGRRS